MKVNGSIKRFVAAAAVVGVLATGSSAWASIVYTGQHIIFSNIQQSVSGPAGSPTEPFGTPTLSWNTLTFTPSAFHAQAPNPGPGYGFIDGTLTMEIQAKPDHTINDVTISEAGDYSLTGTGDSSTFVGVATPIYLQIIGIDGQGVTPILLTATPTYQGDNGGGGSPTGLFNLASNAGQGVPWSGTVTIDLDAVLSQRGINGHVTRALLSLDNSLLAHDQATSGAFIAKKVFIVSVAPEPGTLALIALGVALLVIRRRRAGHAV